MGREKERQAWKKVIMLFRDFSYLWDKKHNDYFDREMRRTAYKTLLLLYNKETGTNYITLADMKKKLENMRTIYGRELKKVNASRQTESESGIYVPRLWYYNLFEFLESTTEPCRPVSVTLDENCCSPQTSTSTKSEQITDIEIYDEEVPEVSIKKLVTKKQKISILNTEAKPVDSDQALVTQHEDDWEIIGKSIGVQLKSLSTYQQVMAHKIINDTLFYGKLGKLTHESKVTLSP